MLRAPAGGHLQALAALPYSFVTMWLAVRGAGLTRENAAGKKCSCTGPPADLGTLALQMLSAWGAKITAIARPPTLAGCLQAGAAEVVDGSKESFASLGRTFDATLNFATWDDDLALVRCLRDGALGHATTVHPLLGNFDTVRLGARCIEVVLRKEKSSRCIAEGHEELRVDAVPAGCCGALGARPTCRAAPS